MKPPSRFRSGRSSASAAALVRGAGVDGRAPGRPIRAPLAGSAQAQRDPEVAGGEKRITQAGEVPRPSARDQPRKRAGCVRRPLEDEAQALAQVAVLGEESHRILPHRMAATSVSGPASRSASRRAPPGVRVQSIVASRLPARSPARVRVSSRFVRVAASITRSPRRIPARRLQDGTLPDLGLCHRHRGARGR